MVGDPLVVGDHLIETFSEDLASAVWWPGVFSPIALNQDLHVGSFLTRTRMTANDTAQASPPSPVVWHSDNIECDI